jgi:hypothetical protein
MVECQIYSLIHAKRMQQIYAQNSTMYEVVRTQLYLKSGTWSSLYYQLHVSASALAIIRLALNLSSDYTICMVCFFLFVVGRGRDLVLLLWVA